LKASDPLGVGHERIRQDLDRAVAIQLRVARFVDLAIPPAPRAERISHRPRREPTLRGIANWPLTIAHFLRPPDASVSVRPRLAALREQPRHQVLVGPYVHMRRSVIRVGILRISDVGPG
jgi:hypothetical protein